MEEKLKKKWVEALRSGDYRQTRGRLIRQNSTGDAHCCLGVLCEVAGLKRYKIQGGNGGMGFEYRDDCDPSLLSREFCEKIGLDAGLANNKLVSMNDQGSGFEEIADYIEANA